MVKLRHLADGAALLEASNETALDLAAALAARPPPGLLDAVPGARTLLFLFDPAVLDHEALPEMLEKVGTLARRSAARTVRLPTSYGGADGPDLEPLAREVGLSEGEVVRLHSAAEHRVAFLGFAPGFAYLSGAPRALSVPRLKTPRVRVPPGSVALADGFTGIYPAATPGGWRLIGRVATRLFDPAATPPALLQPGDRVVFEPVDPASLGQFPDDVPRSRPAGTPMARVLAPGPFSSVQGSPRHGLAASGVPAGGAMDLASLAAANARVGNAPSAAGLEVTLAGLELELLAEARVAVGGGELELSVEGRKLEGKGPHQLRAADRLKLSALSRGLRAYLAVDGGLAEPLPGEPSRPLKRGDELLRAARGADAAGPRPAKLPARLGEAQLEVRAVPGPQLEHFTEAGRAAFFATEYSLSPQSDRRGMRLLGPPLELSRPSDIPSEGTAPGAVQVPGDGKPIVLGPDRPVTGGYAKIATVISADLPLLAQARPGTKIRFRAATLADALAARFAGEEGAR